MLKKSQNSQIKTAQEFINVEAIERNLLWTQDKFLFAFIRVQGMDYSLLDEDDNEAVTDQLTVALSEETQPWQLLSVPRAVDTLGMIQELKEMRIQAEDMSRRKLIDGELGALDEMVSAGAREPMLFLKIWLPARQNADQILLNRAAKLIEKLDANNVNARLMDDGQIQNLCNIYAELGAWQDSDIPSDVPYLKGRRRYLTRYKDSQTQARDALLENITPTGGLLFTENDCLIGSARARCYGASRFPSELPYGWAVKLMGGTDCVTCITFYPGQSSEIGDALSRSIKAYSGDAREERDARQRKLLARKSASADRLIDDLDEKGKALGHMSIVTMPFAESIEELKFISDEVISRYAARRIKLKSLSLLQKEAFRHLSPYYPTQPEIDSACKRIIPLETLVGGYPCTVNTLRDDHGNYFARTADRGIVSLDIRTRDTDRINGNGIVSGPSGIGKSTMLKHLLESTYMQGMRCIIIDPEREYRELCKSLGGTWWDAGGGNGKINLLQIQAPVQDKENDPVYQSQSSPLSQHIQHVLTILYYKFPSITDMQLALLSRSLRDLYENFEIGMETPWEELRLRAPEAYPTFRDLHQLLVENSQESSDCSTLALLLEDMAVGADSVIWDGYTNIDLQSSLVVIDTNQLYNSSARNRTAQYYNLMRLVFSAVSADKETPYFVICDEAQILFDPELPQAGAALKNMADRIRKYEGYLWLAFHSFHELLDERVRINGQPILDSAAYKFLFGTDGANLADTVTLFQLTPVEEKFLKRRQKRKALALIGSRHLKLEFDIPAYKLELMGRGGGR